MINNIEEFRKAIIDNAKDRTDFAYYGELDPEVWGRLPFAAISRDSDTLEKSNHRVILADLENVDPDAVLVERYSHWAVGWVEVIRIDTSNEAILNRAFEWYQKLQDYPIADEEDYSALELEETEENFDSWARDELLKFFDSNPDICPDEWWDNEAGECRRDIDDWLCRLYEYSVADMGEQMLDIKTVRNYLQDVVNDYKDVEDE